MQPKTKRLTVAQATIEFLLNQYVERDGESHRFFAGCFGIFGHGNVAGIGEALLEYPQFRYYQSRNEQAMVHSAIAYARVKNRLGAFVCTSSIGPGATNMITGAATATINRIPVLLLPGDTFSRRNVDPVLQQLEYPYSKDISVNDCFKPVSKYWDRIHRPEQLVPALMQAMRILTSASETGAVTLCLPQDVQAEAFDFPEALFHRRHWVIARARCDQSLLETAASMIRQARKPVIVAGGGTIYSEATDALKQFVNRTGIPVVETFAGKGSLHFADPQNLGAAGVTGTPGAIAVCKDADLVIGIGTRYSDFTTISQSAFQNPEVRFININICEFDAFKQGAIALTSDARETITALDQMLTGYTVDEGYRKKAHEFNRTWNDKVTEIYSRRLASGNAQGAVIGAVNACSADRDIVICAAGSLPGDLHKLWRTRDPKGFHLEYGYSCMGYEIAGGLGAKMADPSREIYVMVGDGSYLLMGEEIITSIQEGFKLTIVLINNHGYASIGGLSKSLGTAGFGTKYRYRSESDMLDGDVLPVDLAANAASLGAHVIRAKDITALEHALNTAKQNERTTVIYIETDPDDGVEGYAWWEVPVSQVSTIDPVKKSLEVLEENKKTQRYYL